jgi:tetratricopeptide (TPR) repeat protein
VDADPFRDAVRDAVLANDGAKLALLANRPEALEQPPGFAAILGDSWVIPLERRRQLLQAAVSRWPGDLGLLMTLAGSSAINQKETADEQVRWYQAAVAAAPANAAAHINLGVALHGKGQLDEAIACLHKAIALDPKLAQAHTSLGNALAAKGQVEEAIACFQQAIALDPKDANAHYNLGNALKAKGKLDEAVASYKKAIALDPKLAAAHNKLGEVLQAKGQLDEAIACLRIAIALDPKLANPHYHLGNALAGKGKVEEAIACYKKAIALDPNYAEAHCNLGHALARQGRFAESLATLKQGHELGANQPGWRYPSAAWVRRAERMAALEGKLPALLKGQYQPRDTAERLDLVGVCQAKKLHVAAARLSADAFVADPKVADDLKAGHRYKAACSAALAAAGQGEDAARLDDKEKARLRQQALAWLKADLALRTKQQQSGQPADRLDAQQKLKHWQKDSDLAGIRDAIALAKLPAEERAACEKLWADVQALLKRAETASPKESRR